MLAGAAIRARAGAHVAAHAGHAQEPEWFATAPVGASQKALAKAGWQVGDVDLWEINEAFASQAIYCVRELGIDPEKVNVNGGAIALGHPIGCSGAAIATKAIHELQRVQGKYALVTMCIGGGQGIATIFGRM